MEDKQSLRSLKEYKKNRFSCKTWLKTHAPFLFDWKSVFYFGVFLFLLAVAWSLNLLIENSGTSLLGWDYTWQFVSFAYDYYDQWHAFFSTGSFPLYDTTIWVGLDNIGSNSFYSLFDPFTFFFVFFPRSWIPYLFSVATFLKLMCSGLLMRWYLRYLGISEAASRIGATALAFSGYMMFMVGFPTTVSCCVYIPLILLGIDKVIRDKKPYCLVIGLFLLGITSFFFLVVACIWGVCYALWRYFWSFKTRSAKDNVTVILMGVASFAVGLLMSAWTLLPSLRQSTLSGRSVSIGSAYLSSIVSSLKSHDLKSFFQFIFEPVGDHPTRELMGIVSFFYPSGGYLYLPLLHTSYDAWTASIFCYTPFIILFFTGVIVSIKQQKWNHIIAILVCLFLLFTNFAYFFFYAFSGNGYGRWFIMLVPEIILYGCWAFDQARQEPRWVRFIGSVLSLLGTLLVYILIKNIMTTATWPNPNELTYWPSSYTPPEGSDGSGGALWYIYLQCAYILAEGVVFIAFSAKKWMPHAWLALLSAEIIVAGNAASSNYYSIYKYKTRYMGGTSNFENSLKVADAIKADETAFGRTQIDQVNGGSSEAKAYTTVLGLNGCSTFHSLMNFDAEDFALMNNMKKPGGVKTTYNETEVYNPSWAGYYGNKRFATDVALGYRYYAVKNDYSDWVDFMPANVPFGATEIYSLPAKGKENKTRYKVYKVGDDSAATLGHAVDSSKLYRLGKEEDSYYLNSFYRNTTSSPGLRYLIRAEDAYLNGAIFEDDAVLPEGMSTVETPTVSSDADVESLYGLKALRCKKTGGLKCYVVTTDEGDLIFPKSGLTGSVNDAAYFLDSTKYEWEDVTLSSSTAVVPDRGHVIFASSTSDYLSEDETGCYIEMKYWTDSVPRVMVFGDVKQDDGSILTNQLLTFEYSSLYNAEQAGYFSSRSSTFGLYVNGHAKYLCFLWPNGNKDIPLNQSNLTIYVTGKQKILQKQAQLSDESLKSVKKKSANEYTFSTDYSSGRIVVTQLGYDKGWSCLCTKEDGTTYSCPMYKLDGGLVGFYAPAGNNTYRLSYVTPYLYGGVALAMVGSSAFFGFAFYSFLRKVKRKEPDSSTL